MITDEILLRQYAATQNADAFAQLVDRYSDMVYATCLRVTRNPHDAEDAGQECFLRLARRAGAIQSSLAGWLHTTARNASLELVESARKRREREACVTRIDNDDSGEAGWEEIEPHIDAAIQELPEELRAPVILHYLQGKPQAEVAEIIGADQSTVSRRLKKGLDELRGRLEKAGVVLSVAALGMWLSQNAAEAAPAAFKASLGKMAIAGVGKAAPAATSISHSSAGSAISHAVNAKIAAAVAAGVLVAAGLITYTQVGKPKPVPRAVTQAAGQTRKESDVVAPDDKPKRAERAETNSKVKHDGDRVWIEGVPSLAWGTNRECTFAGGLEAALAVTDHPVKYADIMGWTGLAFRVRWTDDQSPSSPVGEMPEEYDAVQKATGWQMETAVQLGQQNPDMMQFLPKIVASIDAGLLVPAYGSALDVSVIYGYKDGGTTLILRDYHKGDNFELPIEKLGPLQTYLREYTNPPDRLTSLKEALTIAVRNWKRNRGEGNAPASNYHYGDAAFAAWLRDLPLADGFAQAAKEKFFHTSWWNYISLIDARHAAVSFLQENAPLLDGEASAALERAADLYRQEEELCNAAIEKGEFFWIGGGRFAAGRTVNDWTPAVRERQQEILAEARKLEAAAITEIVKALAAMDSGPNVKRDGAEN